MSIQSDTKVLFHFDNPDGANANTADSAGFYTWTNYNSAGRQPVCNSTITKVGFANSVSFVGSHGTGTFGGMLISPVSNTVNISSNTTNNWCIECFVYPWDILDQKIFWSFGTLTVGPYIDGLRLYVNASKVVLQGVGNTAALNMQTTNNIPGNSWSHLAVVWDKSNSNVCLYMNGYLENRVTIPYSGSYIVQPIGAALNVSIGGDFLSQYQGTYYDGYMDEFRMTYGSSLPYVGNTYSVPSAPFQLVTVPPGQSTVIGSNTNFGVVGNVGDLIIFNTNDNTRKTQAKVITQVISPSQAFIESNTQFFHPYLGSINTTSNVIAAPYVNANIGVGDTVRINANGTYYNCNIQYVALNSLTTLNTFSSNTSNLLLEVFPAISNASFEIVRVAT